MKNFNLINNIKKTKSVNFGKTRKNSTGFTLAEILIYITVLTIIISTVSSFLIWAIRSGTKAKAMRETLYNAERAMATMAHEIKEANGIYSPTGFFDSHPGQLSLETTKYSSQGEETSYIDFYLCDSRLCFKKEGQDPFALTLDNVEVSDLIFQQIDSENASSIRIDLKINYKNPQNRPEYSASIDLTSTFSLRSY